jgi:hypothetical protein
VINLYEIAGRKGKTSFIFGILRSANRSSFPFLAHSVLPHLSFLVPKGASFRTRAGRQESGNESARVKTASEGSGSTALETMNSNTV